MGAAQLTAEKLIAAKDLFYDRVLEELGNSTNGLVELDKWRTETFPEELLKRYQKDPDSLSLSLDELKKLMDWKLKKGKFRPTLKKLIAQNDNDTVVEVTKEAFSLFLGHQEASISSEDHSKLVKKSMNVVTKLRGVGPATGSLILSLLNKITKLAPPFFSDESALLVFASAGDGSVKLKYSLTEYMKYLEIFQKLNEDHFKYDFTEFENGAWSLYMKDEFGLKDEQKGKEVEEADGGDRKRQKS